MTVWWRIGAVVEVAVAIGVPGVGEHVTGVGVGRVRRRASRSAAGRPRQGGGDPGGLRRPVGGGVADAADRPAVQVDVPELATGPNSISTGVPALWWNHVVAAGSGDPWPLVGIIQMHPRGIGEEQRPRYAAG